MVKIFKNPSNRRLNNLNDPVLNVLTNLSLKLQKITTHGQKIENDVTATTDYYKNTRIQLVT